VKPTSAGSLKKGEAFASTAEAVRRLVVSGALIPGQRVRERELCETLNVSRTPVREVIKALIQEGLLEALPNKSAIVPKLDRKEVRSLAVVVATLEGLAAELACAAITDDAIAGMAAEHDKMIRYKKQNNLDAYFTSNKAFHRILVSASNNPVLLWTWDQLSPRADRARFASNLRPARWATAIEEHAGILAAVRARDPQLSSLLMRNHINSGLGRVLEGLEEGTEQKSEATPVSAAPARRNARPASSASRAVRKPRVSRRPRNG